MVIIHRTLKIEEPTTGIPNTPLAPGETTPLISHDVSTLGANVTASLHWEIAFQTDSGLISPWSDPVTFSIETVPVAPTVNLLQDISYQYDAVGNILELVESSGTAATKTTLYSYDDLYRLKTATVTGTTSGDDYTETYDYDELGNMTFKSDLGTYDYAQPGKTHPHAVTKIDDGNGNIREYQYDENGNMTQEKKTSADGTVVTKNYSWDHKDRLKEAHVVGANNELISTVTYSYSSGVTRLLKSVTDPVTTETTLYPFSDYEITKDGTSKVSISANNMHLATVESPSPATSNPSPRRTIFSHGDHLGGSNVLTDVNAEQVQTLDYFPYGKTRVDEQYETSSGLTTFNETKKFTGHEGSGETSGPQ